MVTQILFSIIKTRGRISILKEQISEMESDLSAINMFEEIKNNPSFKFLYYKRFLFISSKYTNYSVSDIIEEIKIKKKKLSQLQAYLQLLQNQYAHKRRKSWQRIKDIALTCGIENYLNMDLVHYKSLTAIIKLLYVKELMKLRTTILSSKIIAKNRTY